MAQNYHKKVIFHHNARWCEIFNADKPFQERLDMVVDMKDF